MTPRLKTLAKQIESLGLGLKCEIRPVTVSTDRHIAGTRLRRVGNGRTGNRLTVRDTQGRIILQHDSAETYRRNSDVEDWIRKLTE